MQDCKIHSIAYLPFSLNFFFKSIAAGQIEKPSPIVTEINQEMALFDLSEQNGVIL